MEDPFIIHAEITMWRERYLMDNMHLLSSEDRPTWEKFMLTTCKDMMLQTPDQLLSDLIDENPR